MVALTRSFRKTAARHPDRPCLPDRPRRGGGAKPRRGRRGHRARPDPGRGQRDDGLRRPGCGRGRPEVARRAGSASARALVSGLFPGAWIGLSGRSGWVRPQVFGVLVARAPLSAPVLRVHASRAPIRRCRPPRDGCALTTISGPESRASRGGLGSDQRLDATAPPARPRSKGLFSSTEVNRPLSAAPRSRSSAPTGAGRPPRRVPADPRARLGASPWSRRCTATAGSAWSRCRGR